MPTSVHYWIAKIWRQWEQNSPSCIFNRKSTLGSSNTFRYYQSLMFNILQKFSVVISFLDVSTIPSNSVVSVTDFISFLEKFSSTSRKRCEMSLLNVSLKLKNWGKYNDDNTVSVRQHCGLLKSITVEREIGISAAKVKPDSCAILSMME